MATNPAPVRALIFATMFVYDGNGKPTWYVALMQFSSASPVTFTGQLYQTTGVPETFVLGKDGVIRKKIIGATDWSSQGTRALVAQLLAEDAGQ